jgi:murein DD-endopeptidase MepM/ murein hydrolase activator NlpD
MSKGPLLALVLLFIAPALVVITLLGLVITVVTTAASASSAPSAAALADIPGTLLPVYQGAAERCGMPWAVLATVGKVESDHGRSQAQGVHSGANFAGASGPMQFLAGTWAAYGVDGSGDGGASVYDPVDAIHGAANYLCSNGAGEGDLARLRSAIWHYNHAEWYVNKVLAQAAEYEAAAASVVAGDYTVPLAASTPGLTAGAMARPHHDYPAWDFPTPTGTPILAAAGGVVAATSSGGRCGNGVIIDGADGHRYTYCHGLSTSVARAQSVAVGQQIMLSGNTGRSTGPHLHFQITVGGTKVCPQSLLQDWSVSVGTNPASAPAAGCTS